MKKAYNTQLGTMYEGTIEQALNSTFATENKGKVDLILTSPPFPLIKKKKYGNLQGQEYIDWLAGLAEGLRGLLKPKGSIVIEVGNSWEHGRPVMSTFGIRSLLSFLDKGNLILCQQFVWHNPTKLPGPAQWVTIERIRVTDSFTNIWWMAKTDRPKANNRHVLREYSPSMEHLLKTQKYNAGTRPSGHRIGEKSFLKNNKGSIPKNVITFSNVRSNHEYQDFCRKRQIEPHPARMPSDIPEFFIKFLTQKGDLVLDPFAGSNTTGAAAEQLGRKWISIEPQLLYIMGSEGRFTSVEKE